ncbi:MAG: hypothetical protein DDT26_02644 [Dehalococcoidia bacterium]|nr:hypothetical protein [Chloroflexota bacterium]
MVRRVLGPWNAAALPENMAGALQESKRCVPERSTKAEQQASNQAPSPEREDVEQEKPERGLTLRLTGGPKARPS